MRTHLLAIAATLIVTAVSCGGGGGTTMVSPGPDGTVVLDVHYSRFSPDAVTVRRGQPVRFVIHNRDPIAHELIVGDQAVQDRHERGTEPHHGERPGEVSVAAGATAQTTVTFTRSGRLLFGCHLPGHWDYGMRGTIRVA
jgi:uncharacterized cupredoxin-like copper-binding protein